MILSSVRAAGCLLVVSLFAASGAYASFDGSSSESAVYAPAGADKQPSRSAKDAAAQASAKERPDTRTFERAASQPARKRWIVPAQ